MMAIIFGILKIIGIMLLVVLGLVLFVVLSVLFVPVRYQAEGSLYTKAKGSASVSWFLQLVSLKVSSEAEQKLDLRILWFHPGRGDDAEESEDQPEEFETEREEELQEKLPQEAKKCADQKEPAFSAENPDQKTAEAVYKPDIARNQGSDTAVPKQKPGLKAKIVGITDLLRKKMHRLKKKCKTCIKKIKKGRVRWERICAFLQNEENQKTFRLFKKQIFALMRHILPRKAKGKVHFGLGDPYLTGQVLTWISPFYGLYARSIQVSPDFMEACLEGELKLKGHIRLATILLYLLPLLLDKHIRRWIRMVRNRK